MHCWLKQEPPESTLHIRLSDDPFPLFLPGRRSGRRADRQPPGDPAHGRLRYRTGWLSRRARPSASIQTLRRPAASSSSGARRVRSFPKAGPIPASSSSTKGNLESHSRLVHLARTAHVEANGRDDDLLIGLQLTHSGRYSFARPILAQHDPLLDPRTIVDKHKGATAGPDFPLISDAELDSLQDRYVAAAAAGGARWFRFRRLEAMPSLPPERAALGPAAPRQVWRIVRKPHEIHP